MEIFPHLLVKVTTANVHDFCVTSVLLYLLFTIENDAESIEVFDLSHYSDGDKGPILAALSQTLQDSKNGKLKDKIIHQFN